MKTLLIVDDSLSVRTMLNLTLVEAGYNVNEAVDGLDALNALEAEVPSLILLDINMPNMDGLTFLEKMREHKRYKFIPVLMLTTETGNDKIIKAKKLGARGWIVKPFDHNELLRTVSMFVR